MLNEKKEFSFELGGKKITLETGRLAKQADGSILISCEGTQVLVTVCSAREVQDGQDFFPLMVDYKEKFYSAGKFLGGFNKREGRPSNQEILLMRMIDRPLRPLFPSDYMAETIVTAQVLSYSEHFDPQVLAGLGTSAAIAISDIPFHGAVGFCRLGKIGEKFIINPTHAEMQKSQLELVVAATADAILMVEGECKEISEAQMLEYILAGQNSFSSYFEAIKKLVSACGKKKREYTSIQPKAELTKKLDDYQAQALKVLAIVPKLERQLATGTLITKVKEDMAKSPEAFGLTASSDFKKAAAKGVDDLLYKMMRADILKAGKRIGGRAVNQVRPIETEVGLLNCAHGSSLFTRGETQVMATVTLGGKEGEQLVDTIYGVGYDRFYLHYSFLPFSVGEAKGYRGVGRREIGHGNLAERAIKMAVKDLTKFPYALRICCEVLESNGSSSMASVCSASMALMDAGVPMIGPVAGVAMGLVKEESEYKILTDILGDEDHLGDMDFKVAGTKNGITAIQMDIKITGITPEIFQKALEEARIARLHILGEMTKSINDSRPIYKEGVPLIETIKIEKDRIGALIGPGGKNIKAIQEQFAVMIEISEEGEVKILGKNLQKLKEVQSLIDMQINGPKIDSEYPAKVVTIKEYGAFVEIANGVSGLVHVSEIANERVRDINDYLDIDQMVNVKVLEQDKFGKLKLSIRAIKPLEMKESAKS